MTITYRRITAADTFTTFEICRRTLEDLSQRTGIQAITGGNDPKTQATLWDTRKPFWEHLTGTSDQAWIAEQNGVAIGYARSILRGDHRELTEFFVLPHVQSAGVGKELLARAFPNDVPHRSIIATPDLRAQARYLKAGVYPFVTEFYLERAPEAVSFQTDLNIAAADPASVDLADLNRIDLHILGNTREVDHRFLMKDRRLFLYKRNGETVGYGYIRKEFYGPFALIDSNDFPAILTHVENEALAMQAPMVGFEVPTINKIAIDHLLQRGYRLEGFMGTVLSEKPFGKFENYLLTSPPYFL